MPMANVAQQIQNNLQQQQSQNNFNFNPNPNEDDKVNIKFKKGLDTISVQCLNSEKFSDAIQKYRNKSGDEDQTDKFFLNAKLLSPDLTIAELGPLNNCEIVVVSTKYIKGAL